MTTTDRAALYLVTAGVSASAALLLMAGMAAGQQQGPDEVPDAGAPPAAVPWTPAATPPAPPAKARRVQARPPADEVARKPVRTRVVHPKAPVVRVPAPRRPAPRVVRPRVRPAPVSAPAHSTSRAS